LNIFPENAKQAVTFFAIPLQNPFRQKTRQPLSRFIPTLGRRITSGLAQLGFTSRDPFRAKRKFYIFALLLSEMPNCRQAAGRDV
jgi:hypothetical protein